MDKDMKKQAAVPVETDTGTANDNFYDESNYGNIEYPVSLYQVDFDQAYTRSIRWHWHEEMEILLIISGSARVTTEDNDQILNPGQGFIINQNVMHSIHSIEGSNCTYYSLVFHPDFIFSHSNLYLRTTFLLPMQSFSALKTMLIEESNAEHKNILAILERVLSANQTKNFGYEMVTKGYLCHFWISLLNMLPLEDFSHPPTASLNVERVKQAILYIREHHTDAVTLEDIAASISVSKSECCRCFKSTIQMTPFEYLMKYRIYEASKQILNDRDTKHSIADFALSVGFNSISYFNKLFRRYLNCTPTEYRERIASSSRNAEVEPFAIPLL